MLIGNVGRDPETRYLNENGGGQGNVKVSQFSLATSERYRDRAGELRENTEWHNIVCWRTLAETAEKYVRKGSQLYVEGKIRTRSWTDQNGGKRYTTEIIADTFQFLGRKSDSAEGQQGSYQASGASYQAPRSSAPAYQQPSAAPGAAPAPADLPEDDLPF